jgi:hypothetical protein
MQYASLLPVSEIASKNKFSMSLYKKSQSHLFCLHVLICICIFPCLFEYNFSLLHLVQLRIEHVIKVLHKNQPRHFVTCLLIIVWHAMVHVVFIDLSNLAD